MPGDRGGLLKPIQVGNARIFLKQVIEMIGISESDIDRFDIIENYNVDCTKPVIGYIPETQEEAEA